MKKIVLIFISVLIYFGCKKENDDVKDKNDIIKYDTVEIGVYFPVYPNSHWLYINQKGDSVLHKTSMTYQLFSNYNPINNPYDTIKYYATQYDSMKVDYYSIYIGSNSYHESGWKMLLPDSIELDNLFQENYIWPSTYNSGKVVAIDTSLLIQNHLYKSVIIVQEFTGPNLGALKCGKTYYAKGIGIIRKEFVDISTDSIKEVEDLIEYKINK